MSIEKGKQAAAEHAVSYVKDGMILGLGTGSTAFFAIRKIGEMVQGGLRISGVPTSLQTAALARELSIPLLASFEEIDLTIDGADEVDSNGYLIKGGGGALTREKIVAANSKRRIIVVDYAKRVGVLGKYPLPLEVLPFGYPAVARTVAAMQCTATLRQSGDETFITDNGNYILDCGFDRIEDAETLVVELNAIPGVVENGLFVGLCDLLVVGKEDGAIEEVSFE